MEQEEAAMARANEGLMWELMYDLDWRLPSTDAEVLWQDACGATNVMQVNPATTQQLIATSTQRCRSSHADMSC